MSAIAGHPTKRQQIVETAYELFKNGGYHATGIDRIIADAGVAKMTMYRNFPSKEGLIVEVLRYRAQRFDERLDRLAESANSTETKIATIIDWHERWFRSDDFHGCLFAHALAEFGEPGHPVFEAVHGQKTAFRARLQRILSDTLPDDQGAATALFMLIEGATLLAQLGQADIAITTLREAAQRILARATEPA